MSSRFVHVVKVKVKSLSHVRLSAAPWTVALQAPPSMGFSRHEYWSGLPFPSPGDLPDPGIEPRSPTLQADALTSEPPGKQFYDPAIPFLDIYLTKTDTLIGKDACTLMFTVALFIIAKERKQ